METSAPIKGGYSLRIPNTIDSTLSETFAGQDDLYVSFYVRVTAYPTATLRIANLTNGTTRTGNIQLTTTGKLRLRNDSTKIGSDSIQLTLGQVYRVGLHQKKGTGSNAILEAYVVAGDGTFATPFASSSAQAMTTQATQFEFGASSTSFGADIVLDDIALDGSAMPGPSLTTVSRTVSYGYDGVYRLVGAIESPGTTYAYSYDLAGNRTGVWVNGVQTQNLSHNAANQVNGWTYDAAGNLLSDGTSTYTYDALSRVTTLNGTTNTYNGDGVLFAQTTGSTSTNYTQDLAAPLSQILSDGTNRYVYGNPAERLFGTTGSTRTWYASDALGSVRASLNDAGMTQAVANYDPWGVPETSTIAPFGFAGELQQGNNVYLRARWYAAGNGSFGSRDAFAGMGERPYSLHSYQYAYAAPTMWMDPSGESPQEEMVKAYFRDSPEVRRNGRIYTEVVLNLGSRTGVRPDWPHGGRIDLADITLLVGYIYEIEPLKDEAIAIEEITHYQQVYRTLPPGKKFAGKRVPEPKTLQLGYGFPKEWRVIGTDPIDPTKAIRAKQTVAGVIVWDREDKVNVHPYPVFVYEYDPRTRRGRKTKPTPSLWPPTPAPVPAPTICPAPLTCPPGLEGMGCIAYYLAQQWLGNR